MVVIDQQEVSLELMSGVIQDESAVEEGDGCVDGLPEGDGSHQQNVPHY